MKPGDKVFYLKDGGNLSSETFRYVEDRRPGIYLSKRIRYQRIRCKQHHQNSCTALAKPSRVEGG